MKQWMFFQALITSISDNNLRLKVDSSSSNFGLFKDSNPKKKSSAASSFSSGSVAHTNVSTSQTTQGQSNVLDSWLDKQIELLERLATSPSAYKKLIRLEWLAVFGLSAWLIMVFTTILN